MSSRAIRSRSTGGGWGAWEIAGRVSTIDLNDQLGSAFGIAGGRQTVYAAGLNWYVNNNIRFMLNYLHGDVAKQLVADIDGGCGFDVRRSGHAHAIRVLTKGSGAPRAGCFASGPGMLVV